MIRINLLPHREQKRKARIQRFSAFLGVFAVGGFVLVGFGALWLSQRLDLQERRNEFLKEELSVLDRQLNEIETLKKERQDLLDRKAVVERLQSNRGEVVQIMDQLVRQTPEGVYLKEIKQEGVAVTLTGYAQSSARVANLMRALEDSPIFESPSLQEIKAEMVKEQKLGAFVLKVQVSRQQVEELGSDKKSGKSKSAENKEKGK